MRASELRIFWPSLHYCEESNFTTIRSDRDFSLHVTWRDIFRPTENMLEIHKISKCRPSENLWRKSAISHQYIKKKFRITCIGHTVRFGWKPTKYTHEFRVYTIEKRLYSKYGMKQVYMTCNGHGLYLTEIEWKQVNWGNVLRRNFF